MCPHNTVIQLIHYLHLYRSLYANTVTTNGQEEEIKKAEPATNAVKQDISREIVQSDEMEVEMETEADSTAMEPVPEMETDSTAKAKAIEPVTETEADPTAKVMEPDSETEVDSTAKGMDLDLETEVDSTAMELVLVMEADTTVKTRGEILDLEAKDSVKETDTTDRSCLEMAPTIRNDSRGQPPSIWR